MQVFKNEIQNGRPCTFRIRDPDEGGHSVVIDGYQDSPLEMVHINMGWGGSYDGWYATNNIVTGGYNWSDVNYQAAVIGIEPPEDYVVAGHTFSFVHGTPGVDSDFGISKITDNNHIVWSKNYGGDNNDYATTIKQTSDGGYIVAGYGHIGTSNGGDDFLLYKLNSQGNKVWRKNFGGIHDDRAFSIQQTSDGGYVVFGTTYSFVHATPGEDSDFCIYKLDANGDRVWLKYYGDVKNDYGRCVQQTADGGYIIAGYGEVGTTNGGDDFLLYKLDSDGRRVWRKNYGGHYDDRAFSVQQTADGGYIAAGTTYSFVHGTPGEDSSFMIIKLDADGNKEWLKYFGGANNDYGYSIELTSDGGYVIAGYGNVNTTNGGDDFVLYKFNSSNQFQWRKNYGGTYNDQGFSVMQTPDGGFLVVGLSYSYVQGTPGTDCDSLIYKLDSNGDFVWQENLGGDFEDGAYSSD
jgi:uncharacterized delta-60 repeat protein